MVAPHHGGETCSSELLVEGHEVVIAHEIHHVAALEPFEHRPHEPSSDPAASPARYDFQERYVGREGPIGDRSDETDHTSIAGASEHDLVSRSENAGEPASQPRKNPSRSSSQRAAVEYSSITSFIEPS